MVRTGKKVHALWLLKNMIIRPSVPEKKAIDKRRETQEENQRDRKKQRNQKWSGRVD